jgi:hypothetical protein
MKVMLLSEKRLKEDSLVNNNVDSMYIYPAIQTAQELGLQPLLGTKLYKKLIQIVETAAEGNERYYYLLDEYVIPYLEMKVMSDIQIPLMYKMRNAGMVQNVVENATIPSMKDDQYLVEYYDNKAKFYADRMSDYIIANRKDYPEYCNCSDCSEMPSNPMSYNTNIYLG